MVTHSMCGGKNREKIVPGQVEHRGDDGQALRSVSVRLRTELEAMFLLCQPALYLWLEDPPVTISMPYGPPWDGPTALLATLAGVFGSA